MKSGKLIGLVMVITAGLLLADEAKNGSGTPGPPTPATAVRVKRQVDGDAAYKANCSRCHMAPRKFSERKMATIMMHMRARGNMTEAETAAILRYLTK